ncbi:type II toxin-antitoxin system VapC family toxin [Glycomyces xiaoerkulensis]|uniref:type II toxin-antitoxin system VapC family toxin n=1 Tax=Glycomyces xiaoerkulensis TaxID=2038139 RepID=UPI000C256BA1|nr:type II toxin-antitoxin system VapC family toxin [Glycomyces xiaoerkulensis]
MIVIDASVVAEILVGGNERSFHLRRSIMDATEATAAPDLLDIEVFSILRKYQRHGKLSDQRAAAAVTDLDDFEAERVPHRRFHDRIWELRHNVSPYDASYIALAERFGAPLWTYDKRLANAPGTRCEIVVPEFLPCFGVKALSFWAGMKRPTAVRGVAAARGTGR